MSYENRSVLAVTLALVLASTPAVAQQSADAVAPEAATETGTAFGALSDAAIAALTAKDAGTPVAAQDWMVAAANPLAVEAGARVLREGGTAADAMVAVQAVLGLVEPQSSGIGGGAFLLYFDAARGELFGYDGRERAPLSADERYLLNDDGSPIGSLVQSQQLICHFDRV